jgi:hypothetical protein
MSYWSQLVVVISMAGVLSSGLGAQDSAPKLVDPAATAETKQLLQRLHEQAGHGILFGHQDTTAYGVGWSDEPGRSDVKDVCGAYPAVYGWDVGDIHLDKNLDGVPFTLIKRLIRESDARGGINAISMHLDNPVTGRNAWDNSRAVRAVLPGGASHASFLKTLDQIAAFLNELKRQDYMDGYPGDEFVDIFGLDYYKIRSPQDAAQMGRMLSMVAQLADGHGKVAALTETGIDRVGISNWWTERLLPALDHDEWSRQVVWALVWRNKSRGHHFGPFPGHATADDFVKFYDHPMVVLGAGLK